jgi:proteasome lid subunit RPN8/RPN11
MGDLSSSAFDRRVDATTVTLPSAIRAAIVAHAVVSLPNEACGIILAGEAAVRGHYLRFVPAHNAARSPHRFEIDVLDLLAVLQEADTRDETVLAIVHSHPASAAEPSAIDAASASYPDAVSLIVSLAPGRVDPTTGEPELRAWRMDSGVPRELTLR